MCVVSMVIDHYHEKWLQWQHPPVVPYPWPTPVPTITPEEIDEFRRLLERARKYDKENNQPDCELEEKKQKLMKLAEELGVEITFP